MPIHGLPPPSSTTQSYSYPKHFNIESAIRPNILALHPYRCARDDYTEGILLDANENALGHSIASVARANGAAGAKADSGSVATNANANANTNADAEDLLDIDFTTLDLHRYPDPAQRAIKARIASLRGLTSPSPSPSPSSPHPNAKPKPKPRDDYIFLGVGSDEVLDLLIRVLVTPGKPGEGGEKVMITPPTYGMYAVCAQVNDVEVVKVPLRVEGEGEGDGGEGKGGMFQLDLPAMKRTLAADPLIKLIFLCSPGNPTGTLLSLKDIQELLEFEGFRGVVVVDEAYIDFASPCALEPRPESNLEASEGERKNEDGEGEKKEKDAETREKEKESLKPNPSAVTLVERYANLCVSQTLSKSFGLAAIRLGIAIAQPPLIQILSNTKAPYNISTPSAALALAALSPASLSLMRARLSELGRQRRRLLDALDALGKKDLELGLGEVIGGNHANFVLVRILEKPKPNSNSGGASALKPDNARSEAVYKELAEREGVVVRFRGREYGCEGCLRITVGSEEENGVLIRKLGEVLKRV